MSLIQLLGRKTTRNGGAAWKCDLGLYRAGLTHEAASGRKLRRLCHGSRPFCICFLLTDRIVTPVYQNIAFNLLCRHQTLIIANLLMAYLVGSRLTAFTAEMRRRFARGLASERGDALVAAALTGIGSLIFWPLYSTRMIPEENGRIFSGGSCWADLPIHMHIAESFLSGRNQDVSWGDMHSPVFAGALRQPARPVETHDDAALDRGDHDDDHDYDDVDDAPPLSGCDGVGSSLPNRSDGGGS